MHNPLVYVDTTFCDMPSNTAKMHDTDLRGRTQAAAQLESERVRQPDRFPKLPEFPARVHCKIWAHASLVPRVVGLFESHDDVVLHRGRLWNGNEPATVMMTKSRPPALLSACRESRMVALTIFQDVGKKFQTRGYRDGIFDNPCYINPEIDTIYRAKKSCFKGDAFRIRHGDWLLDREPLAITKTLAVDLAALTQLRQFCDNDVLFSQDRVLKDEEIA
jgi:hypothetical protein